MTKLPHMQPVRRKILAALNDGKPHIRAELCMLLWDDLGINKNRTLMTHICHIRKALVLGRTGKTILAVHTGKGPRAYQLVTIHEEERSFKLG